MRGFKQFRKYWIMGLCAVMLVLGGCQAVGGVDLNKALLSSFDVQSMEGSGYLELTVESDGSIDLGQEDKELLEVFGKTKIRLDHVKQENREMMSVKGAVELAKGAIPFQAHVSPDKLVIQVEGAKKPFVIDPANPNPLLEGPVGGQSAWLKSLSDQTKDPNFLKPLYSYLVGKLPNPKDVSLNSGMETVHGDNVFLHHVTAKMKVNELIPLLKTFILNLMQDDQAMKEVIKEYHEVLPPLVGMMDTSMMLEDHSASALLADETAGLELVHAGLKQQLAVMLVALQEVEQEANQELGEALGSGSGLTVDLYVDSSMKVRKSGMELTLLPPSPEESGGIKSVRLKSSFENWNVNQAVKADMLPAQDAVPLLDLEDPAELLQHLDSTSVLYRLLKEDLHVTRKTAYFYMLDVEELEDYHAGWAGYLDDGLMMVPVRPLAESLALKLEWNDEAQSTTLESVQGTSLIFTVGSNKAVVNGQVMELEETVVLKEGHLYVPLRFAADSLGAQIEWDADERLAQVIVD